MKHTNLAAGPCAISQAEYASFRFVRTQNSTGSFSFIVNSYFSVWNEFYSTGESVKRIKNDRVKWRRSEMLLMTKSKTDMGSDVGRLKHIESRQGRGDIFWSG